MSSGAIFAKLTEMSRSSIPWLVVSENEAAWHAVSRLLDCIPQTGQRHASHLLFLHGPSGTGKTRLLQYLHEQAGGLLWSASSGLLSASDDPGDGPPLGLSLAVVNATTGPVLLDDLHRLAAGADSTLAALVDHCLNNDRQLVVTATVGPALVSHWSRRLASRLGSGLVVGLQALGPASRRLYLLQAAAQRNWTLSDEVVDYLVAQLPGSFRALEGALIRLEMLGPQPSLAAVQNLFVAETPQQTATQTLERIVAHVCAYYQVPAKELRSARRSRAVMVPRQVSMYLARQLTGLSLVAIGEQLGGRDHSTVLHACRKIEEELQTDANLCRAVRELAAGLGLAAGR